MPTPKDKTAYTLVINKHLWLKVKIENFYREDENTLSITVSRILRDYFKQQKRQD